MKNAYYTGQSDRPVQTVAETQNGSADLHRSIGSGLFHTAVAVAATSGANANRYNHGRRNNRCLDELRDNADFKVGLSWMVKAKVVNVPETALKHCL